MKRQLKFDFADGNYVLKESDEIVFSINGNDLKFVSVEFYNGLYKGKSAAIEVINIIKDDPLKKGQYIFNWLSEIVNAVQKELNDPEIDDCNEIASQKQLPKLVPLFPLSACAGSGFYSEGPSTPEAEIEAAYPEADYAVRISGKSMEPTIQDQSIVFVKVVEELEDGDVGIFVVNGDVMCKRYRCDNGGIWLHPDNDSGGFDDISISENTTCILQGRVLVNKP